MSEQASVIIVSRHRPDELRRNLPAFRFQTHRNFELILVADPAGLAVARDLNLSERMKLAEYDEANISAARNLGLAQAAAPLVAFIDDDATPEPPWLERLLAPFADEAVTASTGFTRGRNGISYQWQGVASDETGADVPLEVPGDAVSLHPPANGRVVKTHGTNCAFRRRALAVVGGFDPAFRFFLDETDVNHRMARAGRLTAISPLAQVQHGYAANATRAANRAPTDLTQIGRSAAVFLRRHCPEAKRENALEALRLAQQKRLENHRAEGRLIEADFAPLMQGLAAGITEGMGETLADLPPLPEADQPFLPFPQGPQPSSYAVISCTLLGTRRKMAEAKRLAASGDTIVTLLRLSRTPRRHKGWFDPGGFWVQRGGLFGASDRTDPPFRWWRRPDRIKRETLKIAAFRHPNVKLPRI